MRVLPILFNIEMVQALLAGRKTCTRRLVKFLPGKNPQWTGYIKDGLMLYNGKNEPCIRKAPYQPGDILYVRETWGKGYEEGTYIYKADDKLADLPTFKDSTKLIYRPSIHMPKEAARIWLKVTDVRVERLQDIMEEEPGPNCQLVKEGVRYGCDFIAVWNSTIKESDRAAYGWDANPWVWVIEFEQCEKPPECILNGYDKASDDGEKCLGYGYDDNSDTLLPMCAECRYQTSYESEE